MLGGTHLRENQENASKMAALHNQRNGYEEEHNPAIFEQLLIGDTMCQVPKGIKKNVRFDLDVYYRRWLKQKPFFDIIVDQLEEQLYDEEVTRIRYAKNT